MPEPSSALLFIHAQTPMHPGTGASLGTVDLPIQRERITQWPFIQSSSLKGVLRSACNPGDNGAAKEEWNDVFGPETDMASEHAGALSVTDARLLAFPVRSLKGVFAWVTCPGVLERFQRDLLLARTSFRVDLAKPQPAPNTALCRPDSPLLIAGNKLVLEEFEFDRTGDADQVANWIADQAFAPTDTFTPERFKSHFVVLHDDDFTHFVKHATEVVARVGLDYERKTVKSGALFYEEFLPAETLLYCLVFAAGSRRNGQQKTSREVISYLYGRLPSYLQIGGDETIGKGLCALRLLDGKESA